MKEILYCVEILRQKHELLNKDRKYFYKIQHFEECALLRDDEKKIEVIVKKLLEECRVLINSSKSQGNKVLINHYNVLISYFDLDYETRKAKLEIQLTIQKLKLDSMLAIYKFRLVDQIRGEIKQTERELRIINDLMTNENET